MNSFDGKVGWGIGDGGFELCMWEATEDVIFVRGHGGYNEIN